MNKDVDTDIKYHEYIFTVNTPEDYINISWIFKCLIHTCQEVYGDTKFPRLVSKCNQKQSEVYETMLTEFLRTKVIHVSYNEKPTDMMEL
jgi:hypothetical protein